MSKPVKGLITAEADAAMGELRARVAGRRPKGRYYLIVCEGTKTEPNYFESFRSHLSGGEGDKVVVVGAQDNTLGLVERARAEIAARNESDNPPFYHVWLVFDKDSFPDDDFDNTIVATRQEDEKFGMDGSVLRPHWLLHGAMKHLSFGIYFISKRIQGARFRGQNIRIGCLSTLDFSIRRTHLICLKSFCQKCQWQ